MGYRLRADHHPDGRPIHAGFVHEIGGASNQGKKHTGRLFSCLRNSL